MNTVFVEHQGKICAIGRLVFDSGICSKKQWSSDWLPKARTNGYAVQTGGNGRPSLIELKAIPTEYRDRIIAKFGNPETTFNPLERFFELDAKARSYYTAYRHPNGKALEPYQIDLYTTNASVLNALAKLRDYRVAETKIKGNPKRNLKDGLAADCIGFNEVLKLKYNGLQHKLPEHPRKLNDKLNEYLREDGGYGLLVDGRSQNTNAQVVTPEMLHLWKEMFAGQRHKPTHIEVHAKYTLFLMGKVQVINTATGEVYDHTQDCYRACTDSTVYNWLGEWETRVGLFKARAGNRKTYMDSWTPSARMLRPSVGAIISVDDYQPPFKWGEGSGNRMWFYAAQDLGSTAIVSWVYGDAKEGIITDFYRQLAIDYSSYGVQLPYEIECEASLNSSFTKTFLAPGNMFSKVRILPNKPRAKRIERTIRDLRLQMASKHPAFVARPDAKDENYQQKPGKQLYLSKQEIIEFELRVIENWNNELHPDQDVYPGLTRWQVFTQHQNEKLPATNWCGILPHLGNVTPTSMKMGRIRLQGIDRVVGINGRVALGNDLIGIMNEIEGCEVSVYWMPDANGDVLKAQVYSSTGRYICDVLDDLPFHRSELDQTEQCKRNMALYFAYEKTVDAHANRIARSIAGVELMEEPKERGEFRIAALNRQVKELPATVQTLPDEDEYQPVRTTGSTRLSVDNF